MSVEENRIEGPTPAESELPPADVNGIAVDPEIMFSNPDGVYRKRIEKRQRKRLSKVDFLRSFLEPDEQVIQVTAGCFPMSGLERALGGWVIFSRKRAWFVFTDRRVFCISIKPKPAAPRCVSYFAYSDCKSITIRGTSLMVRYHRGGPEKFPYLRFTERKKLKTLFRDTPLPAPDKKPSRRIHLCPECTAPLQPQVYVCLECGLEFKNRKTAQRWSILLPGVGYFYTGRRELGIIDVLVGIGLTFFVLFAGYQYFRQQPQVLCDIILFGLLLILEKLISIHQTNHFIDEYIPVT